MVIFGTEEANVCRSLFGMRLVEDALEHLWYRHEMERCINCRDDIRDAIYILEETRMTLAEEYEQSRTIYSNRTN